jgi:asparagine synthase (glutamine-hydrolysing)
MAHEMPPTEEPVTESVADSVALPLTRWELASGSTIGSDRRARGLPPPGRGTERDAISAAVLPALRRPPCVVSFSGGLDSSVVLAVAVAVAREHGLPDPVPVSLRFPGVESAQESAWQELVVAHLRIADWERIDLAGELDFLGELACAGLTAHGLLWPANAHFHVPVFAAAAGGAVLTGLDGDGLFGGWRWQRARAALARERAAEPRDALRIALALAPPSARAAGLLARPRSLTCTWLRPQARRRISARLALVRAREPSRWDQRVGWYARRRYLRLGTHSLRVLARRHAVEVVHPLLDPGFLATLAARGGASGYGARVAAVRRLFGDLLPAELIGRGTKGEFGAAMWGERARAFAEDWDGRGLDDELIDPDALRRAWRAANPPLAAATVIQAAWLATR